jgi:hypothetical protein
LDSFLTAHEESSRGPLNLRRHSIKIVLSYQPKRDSIAEFRVQASQPGLDRDGILFFGEHSDKLEGEPQTLLGITMKLASIHPPINRADVPGSARIGGELAANKPDEILDDL